MIHCLMKTGGLQTTTAMNDALLQNAVDMVRNQQRRQRIKSRSYDGVIESSLEVFDFLGAPVVRFNAIIGCDLWDAGEIDFLVRMDSLDEVELGVGEWVRGRIVGVPEDMPESEESEE